jgi:hypothetical protein
MACIAYKCPEPVTVTCPPQVGCPPFNPVPDTFLVAKEINCCILRGRVLCGTDFNNPVAGVIVFATSQTTGTTFAGITNDDGEYCICVPANDTYEIQSFCCTEDCCDPVPCVCACNGDPQ